MEKLTLEKHHKISKKLLLARDLPSMVNKEQTINCKVTRTRFPPEPNGFLHLGHVKAIVFNFEICSNSSPFQTNSAEIQNKNPFIGPLLSKVSEKGEFTLPLSDEPGKDSEPHSETILRFDDTNPCNECLTYEEAIKESLRWLGFTPTYVTYASDYFTILYRFALKLIREDKAFVCEQSVEQSKESRERKEESPFRNRPVSESLALFERMSAGEVEERKMVLRLKLDPASPNTTLRDPAIFRVIKSHAHHRNKLTGYDKHVYPLYDFTHCICDSLENITISCCTLEFEIRRDLYYAILEKVGIYRPYVYEFARLQLKGLITSKRNIKSLIDRGIVRGWDDPRLATIAGMRRRGIPPQALVRFCEELGVTRNASEIDRKRFDFVLRENIDPISQRAFCVPLEGAVRVKVANAGEERSFRVPTFPNVEGNDDHHLIRVKDEVFIDGDDFIDVGAVQEEAKLKKIQKNYFGMHLGKANRMKYCFNVECKEYDGKTNTVVAHADYESDRVKKGTLSFVSGLEKDNRAVLRIYGEIVKGKEEASLRTREAMVSQFVVDQVWGGGSRWFQFERVGYFYVDEDTFAEENREKKIIYMNSVLMIKSSMVKEKLLR